MFLSHLNFCISLHTQLWSWLLSVGELVPWGMCLKLEMYRIFKGWRDGACEVFGFEGRDRFEWDSGALVTHLPGDSPTSFLLDCTAPHLKLCCLLNSSKHSQGTSVVSVCTHLVSSYWKCLKETRNATEQANNSIYPDLTCCHVLYKGFLWAGVL